MKKRQYCILFLAMLLMLSNITTVFASGLIFTDVKDHWAQEYIEDIYNRKITVGYTDATFRPSNSITNLETAVMLANLLGYKADSNLLLKYDTILKQSNIPAWAQGQIAFLMDKSIIYQSEVKVFVTNSLGNNAKRFEVANYIGRILVILANKTLSRSFHIPYKDELQIPNDSKPYIDLLLTENILNKDSNEGRFLPNSNITRAETAKLIAITAKILDAGGKVTPPATPVNTTAEGIVNSIVIANRTVLTISDASNNVEVFDVKADAKVTLDNKSSTLAALEKGQTVKLKLVNNVVDEITATGNKAVVEGFFHRLFTNEGATLLTVKTPNNEYKYYTVANNTKVSINGELSTFSNFKVGDKIKAHVSGSFVYEVEGNSKNKTIKGLVSSKGTTTDKKLEVTPKDEAPIMLTLDNNTVIKRNGRTVTLNDVKVHDEVTVEMEFDVVKSVTAASVKRTIEGTIKKIVNADEHIITVENKNLESEEFVIGGNTIILIDNAVSNVYDLRLNYSVMMHIEGNEVTTIFTSKRVEPETIIGKVKSINREINVMTVLVEENGTSKEMQVHVKNTTQFIAKTGGTWHFSLIKEGDQLVLVGTVNSGAFILERVMVIN